MATQIVAGIGFLSGSLIVATRIAVRLGWLLTIAGVVVGVAVGTMAGIIWATAQLPARGAQSPSRGDLPAE